jgi:2-dehydropantoate 2-reductase
VAKGRPTEIDEMTGHVVARGRECGVATPVSNAVVAMIHEIEQGVGQPAPEHLDEALRRAGV